MALLTTKRRQKSSLSRIEMVENCWHRAIFGVVAAGNDIQLAWCKSAWLSNLSLALRFCGHFFDSVKAATQTSLATRLPTCLLTYGEWYLCSANQWSVLLRTSEFAGSVWKCLLNEPWERWVGWCQQWQFSYVFEGWCSLKKRLDENTKIYGVC